MTVRADEIAIDPELAALLPDPEGWTALTERRLAAYARFEAEGRPFPYGEPIVSDRGANRVNGKRYVFLGWSKP